MFIGGMSQIHRVSLGQLVLGIGVWRCRVMGEKWCENMDEWVWVE